MERDGWQQEDRVPWPFAATTDGGFVDERWSLGMTPVPVPKDSLSTALLREGATAKKASVQWPTITTQPLHIHARESKTHFLALQLRQG